jgi:lysozyme
MNHSSPARSKQGSWLSGLGASVGALALATAAFTGCAPPAPEDQIGDKSAEVEGALRQCGGGTTVEGIDVSQWQSHIDWSKVATTNVKWTIIRVSDGGYKQDSEFAANWSGAKNAGLVRGVYQFFRPAQDPIKQANLLLSAIAQDPIGAGDFPAVLDVETVDGVSTATIRKRIHQWLDEIETKTGKKPIIYTAAFMQNVLGSEFSDYPLWVANYTTQCPLMPSGWKGWDMWQYSDHGHVAGVPGSGVDRDVFDGSMSDLLAYVGAGPVSQPDPQSPPPDPQSPPPDPQSPTSPSGLSPADGAHETSSSVTMSCDSFTGATSYQFDIQVYQGGAWSDYYTYSTLHPTQTFWPQVANAPYRFRVRAVTGSGPSDYSGWSRFAFGNATLP